MKIKLAGITLLISLLMTSFMKTEDTSKIIFDFNKSSDIGSWKIVNDGVMGGISNSTISINTEGHGVFKGTVSTENNGGFASVRLQLPLLDINNSKRLRINLKGDGKNYQLRVKSNTSDYYSYITEFSTSGSWETIEINLKDLYPSFRGRKLDQENFSASSIQELSFLIANKKNESFILELDKIELD
ncbi:MAG: NADH dehydrogenase [ubiquinone] 1 alpha subcomplex assembly factor 1 [Vicingaceae bacterium]|jgi:NADH dehydrogenase [ubiquinone] 1 alpha subcomplex assembly factor 1